MERGLLSDPQLQAHHDDVVWMYLFQDFTHSERDRAAERVAIRFGITAWPQHFLVDPFTLQVLGDTGRKLGSFRSAVQRASVTQSRGITAEELAARDALAASLEGEAPLALARKHLTHEDVVVRFRAIERLLSEEPETIVAAAAELLATPHDQTRFVVCQVLAKALAEQTIEPAIVDALEALVTNPVRSKNPNVLRMRAVQALARCGGRRSIAIVAPHATSGLYFNGLTRCAVDCLVAIARQEPAARAEVAERLREAFPEALAKAETRELRACTALARHVHDALRTVTGRNVAFPPSYDAAARTDLIQAWAKAPRRPL